MPNVKTVAPLGTTSAKNVLAYSEQFDNAYWSKVNATVTANAAAAPTGAVTADALMETAAAAVSHYANRQVSVTAGTTYTLSVYAKSIGRNIQLRLWDGAGDFATSTFNLATGAVISGGGAIADVGGGWYRCSISGTSTATSAGFARMTLHNGASTTYTGDGTGGALLWGSQLEVGAMTAYGGATLPADFTTLAAWNAYAAAQATADQWAECYSGNLGTVTVSGWSSTPTASVYPRVYSHSSCRPDGSTTAGGAYIDATSGQTAFANGIPFLEIDGIQFRLGGTNPLALYAATTTTFTGNKVVTTGTDTAPRAVRLDSSANGALLTLTNNAVYYAATNATQTGAWAFYATPAAGTTARLTAVNNTVICNGRISGGLRFNAGSGSVTATSTNNLLVGGIDSDFNAGAGSTITQTYCISSDDSADNWGGAGNKISKTSAQFQTNSFALLPESDARNSGINAGVTADMVGSPRPQGTSFDIGAIEFVQGSSGPGGVGQIVSAAPVIIGSGDWAD